MTYGPMIFLGFQSTQLDNATSTQFLINYQLNSMDHPWQDNVKLMECLQKCHKNSMLSLGVLHK